MCSMELIYLFAIKELRVCSAYSLIVWTFIVYLINIGSVDVIAQNNTSSISPANKNIAIISSHNSFIDKAGILHIVGEVQNNSPINITFAKLVGTFYDSNNRVVGTAFTYTDPQEIQSRDAAPFDLILLSASIPVNEIDHYKLRLVWQETGSAGQGTTERSASQILTGSIGSSQQQGLTQGFENKVSCGEVVSGIVNVGSNLMCTGDGLIVNESNTVVNLNGHSIVGPGTNNSKVGFMIPDADNVTIQGPGTVSHFQAGLLITGSNNVKVKSLNLTHNEIGIFTTGSDGAQVQKNIIDSNNIGFASHSSDGVKVDTNIMTNNPLAAITLVNTHKSQITVNTAEGSQNGVFVDQQSTDNQITGNNVTKNKIDLNNANDMPPSINNNLFEGNTCDTSTPIGLCQGK